MTAEVAVMNPAAVALAADSAVTVDVGRAKIFRSANKLFTLSKYEPIGIMIYGSADLNGVPWETVIKSYRRDLGDDSFDSVRDYVDHFFTWLARHPRLFSQQQQDEAYVSAVASWMYFVHRQIRSKTELVADLGDDVPPAERMAAEQIAAEEIALWIGRLGKRPKLPGSTTAREKAIVSRTAKVIEGLVGDLFSAIPLTAAARRSLMRAPRLFTSRSIDTQLQSGVVFAGFGREEYLPVVVNNHVEFVMDGVVHANEAQTRAIDADSTAIVIPFAQHEMVRTFLEGITPNMAVDLENRLGGLSADLADRVRKARGRALTPKDAEALAIGAKELQDDLIDDLNERQKAHWQPILRTVSVLPKDELAAMAEALVNLTRFKRRVSMDEPETVAGEIDVAVISKGDGFVWIKRKHYFDLEHNAHWRANYYR